MPALSLLVVSVWDMGTSDATNVHEDSGCPVLSVRSRVISVIRRRQCHLVTEVSAGRALGLLALAEAAQVVDRGFTKHEVEGLVSK